MMRRAWPVWCATSLPSWVGDIERRIRARDVALRVSTKDGAARVVCATTTGLLLETVKRHKLAARTRGHRPFLELLGTHLSFTNILTALQEGEERVVSRFTANEATIITEALALGECRCYLSSDCNANLIGVPHFPLKVNRILYGKGQPFSSVTSARLEQLLRNDNAKDQEENVTGMGECSPSVTTALKLDNLPREKLLEFFQYNISLHGYNFLRQSEGSVSALWCRTQLDDPSIIQALIRFSETDSTLHDVGAWMSLETAIKHAGLSYGILVQPLVAGNETEMKIHRLHESLMRASIECPELFRELTWRATGERCLVCQDSLALVTGDHEGAYATALAARQFTQDPAVAAPVIERVRRELGLGDDDRLSLDCTTLVRNGLDYFCRCSKKNFLQSLVVLSKEELLHLMQETSFRCVYCAKEHQLVKEDWEKLLEKRVG